MITQKNIISNNWDKNQQRKRFLLRNSFPNVKKICISILPDMYEYDQQKQQFCEITTLGLIAKSKHETFTLLDEMWKLDIDVSILTEVHIGMIPMLKTYTKLGIVSNHQGQEKKMSIWDYSINFTSEAVDVNGKNVRHKSSKTKFKFPTIFVKNREEFYMSERVVVNIEKIADINRVTVPLPTLKEPPPYIIAQMGSLLPASVYRIPSTFEPELIPPMAEHKCLSKKVSLMFTKIRDFPTITNVSDLTNIVMIRQGLQRKACDIKNIKSLKEIDFIDTHYSCKYTCIYTR